MHRLEPYGWNPFFSSQIGPDEQRDPGRVVGGGGARLRVATRAGEVEAVLAGRLRSSGAPAVGDWVLLRPTEHLIERVLARRTALSRGAAGTRPGEQVLAANVDVVFVVLGLDRGNLERRLERYVAAAWEGGAQPVVVLNKADLAADPSVAVGQAEAAAPGAPVELVSAHTNSGVGGLGRHLREGATAVFLGPSGVGKSSIINRLLGREAELTGAVRALDGRGRHTTTARQLHLLPGGGMVIDGPGIRELELWGGEDALDLVFADIATLAAGCRFRDCRHSGEPGCEVEAAVAAGALAAERLASFRKLASELAYQARKVDATARLEENRRWKLISREVKRMPKKRL